MVKATWKVTDDRFAEFKRRQHQGMEVAGTRLSNRMVKRAQEIASQRHRTGAMESGIRARVEANEGVVTVTLEDPVWYAHFQDHGTKSGVTPLLFLEQALSEGRAYALAELAANEHNVV